MMYSNAWVSSSFYPGIIFLSPKSPAKKKAGRPLDAFWNDSAKGADGINRIDRNMISPFGGGLRGRIITHQVNCQHYRMLFAR
jgi:hypothetical protein